MSEGGTTRRRRGIPAAVVLAALLTLSLVAGAHAADGGLVVIADTRYEVRPEEGRVHVTIDAEATSFEPDTDEGSVYYSGITFAVPADAVNIVASSDGTPLLARVVEATDAYQAVEVVFARGVFYRETYPYTVSFDLVDAGGLADRNVRIGRSLVAFPVWAFGTDDEPGSSVRVDLPAGYQATVQGSTMAIDARVEGTMLTAEPDDPFEFYAYVSADRAGAFAESTLEVPMREEAARLTIRAWDDDPGWAARTSTLLSDGLPVLEALIGISYPLVGRLSVEEAAISRLGDYAGIYDPTAAVIHVRYDADAFVTLHEAAHLWFNDRLLDGRWIGEAWAEFYSIEAGEEIGAEGFRWELTDELIQARIPLNDWGAVGREDLAIEDFAYAASYEVARRIAERTDMDELRRVWQAASNREPAYQPPDGSADDRRTSPGQPGWQRLLDLLDERTGESYADIWAEWVVNEEQQPLLAARASARARYDDVLEQAGDWQLPVKIRRNLGDWAFDEARLALQQAERILGERERIARLASGLDLAMPDRLRRAFEGDGGLEAAANLAQVELNALAALSAAAQRLAVEPSLLEEIGLFGSDPGALLAEARVRYEAGELGEAQRGATRAVEAREAGTAAGRSRVALAAGLVLTLDGLALSTASALRLARRRGYETYGP